MLQYTHVKLIKSNQPENTLLVDLHAETPKTLFIKICEWYNGVTKDQRWPYCSADAMEDLATHLLNNEHTYPEESYLGITAQKMTKVH